MLQFSLQNTETKREQAYNRIKMVSVVKLLTCMLVKFGQVLINV